MSVSPPGQEQRKARELNPHDLKVARGFQDRPGNPYPATFLMSVDPARVELALPARQAGVFPLDHRPISQSGEWESNPRCPAPRAGGLPLA